MLTVLQLLCCFPPFFPCWPYTPLREPDLSMLQPLNWSWPMPGARKAEYTTYFNFFILSLCKRSVCRVWVGQSPLTRTEMLCRCTGMEVCTGSCNSSLCIRERSLTAEVSLVWLTLRNRLVKRWWNHTCFLPPLCFQQQHSVGRERTWALGSLMCQHGHTPKLHPTLS